MEATGAMATCLICGGDTATFASSTEVIQKFLEQLGVQDQGLSFTSASEVALCEDCNSGVVKALEWREEVGEVERDVRSLQRIILKMMRQLTSLQGNYLGEMKRLEGKIRNNERGDRRKSEGSPCIADKMDAIRQGILDVVVDLTAFQPGLDSQTEGSNPSEPEVADLTQQHNPSTSHLPIPSETVIKKEVGPLKETTSGTGEQEEESLPGQDPLSPENDDPIDIEHVVYSEDPTKREPLPDEPSDDESNSSVPVVVSKSSISRLQSSAHRGYACRFCGKRFTQSFHLKRHEYTHTGERPFKCHLCPMAFGRTDTLQDHLRGHSGKKPFTCARCGNEFRRKDHLERHKKRKICRISE